MLSKLFVEGKVVVMKANPVNDYLLPHWSRALKPLLDAGVLRIVDGGAAAGQYLTAHPRIDEVHITGSDKTYDAVVFGAGEEGARRKAADEPRWTSRSPPSSATCHPSSSCRASGRFPSCATRPTTSRRCW